MTSTRCILHHATIHHSTLTSSSISHVCSKSYISVRSRRQMPCHTVLARNGCLGFLIARGRYQLAIPEDEHLCTVFSNHTVEVSSETVHQNFDEEIPRCPAVFLLAAAGEIIRKYPSLDCACYDTTGAQKQQRGSAINVQQTSHLQFATHCSVLSARAIHT